MRMRHPFASWAGRSPARASLFRNLRRQRTDLPVSREAYEYEPRLFLYGQAVAVQSLAALFLVLDQGEGLDRARGPDEKARCGELQRELRPEGRLEFVGAQLTAPGLGVEVLHHLGDLRLLVL